MHTINLDKLSESSEHAECLLEEIDRLRKEIGRVYWTHVFSDGGAPTHVFTTTNRDIQLFLGQLFDHGHRHLAALLDEELAGSAQALLVVGDELDKGGRKTLLVSKVASHDRVKLFSFSPAN